MMRAIARSDQVRKQDDAKGWGSVKGWQGGGKSERASERVLWLGFQVGGMRVVGLGFRAASRSE